MSPPAPPRPNHYPLAIIGAGALGLHFAARLADVMPVAVIARDHERAARLKAGVTVGDRVYRADAFAADAPPPADWVIVLVKAGDTTAAAAIAAVAVLGDGSLIAADAVLDVPDGPMPEIRPRIAAIVAATTPIVTMPTMTEASTLISGLTPRRAINSA